MKRDLWILWELGFNVMGLCRLRGVGNCKLPDLNQAGGGSLFVVPAPSCLISCQPSPDSCQMETAFPGNARRNKTSRFLGEKSEIKGLGYISKDAAAAGPETFYTQQAWGIL